MATDQNDVLRLEDHPPTVSTGAASHGGVRGVTSLAVLVLLAAGCGTEKAQDPSVRVSHSAVPGVAPELVHVLGAKGYTLAAGGEGPYGADGFQAVYTSGRTILKLTVEPRTLTAKTCPALPIPDAAGPVTCTHAADGWYRTTADHREYALTRGGDLLIRLSTGQALSRKTLHTLALAVRPAAPAAPGGSGAPSAPPPRGDIPTTGDGAPVNSVGPGG
ncbi:hypothetical protein ACRYCC_25050 [Actinomadura scrupuli]|uniref:hypothetical protein n=1 Tax=Actinomadura scrupuli TaxID=559629 RepID=UPI003D98D3AE